MIDGHDHPVESTNRDSPVAVVLILLLVRVRNSVAVASMSPCKVGHTGPDEQSPTVSYMR